MRRIVLHNKYREYLETLDYINNVEVMRDDAIKCDMTIDNDIFSLILCRLSDDSLPYVILCNPDNENTQKSHIIQTKINYLFYLCLSTREDISVRNKNYKQILDYTFLRVRRLLTLSPEEEKRELRKEFLFFWNRMSQNLEKIALFLESSQHARELEMYRKNEKLICISPEIKINDIYFKKYKPIKAKGIYIPLINSSEIIPPLEGKPWNVADVEYILNNCVSDENVDFLEDIKISKGNLIIAFEMLVPETLPITFVMELKFSNKKSLNIYESLNDITEIKYLSSQRFDSNYLFKRIGVALDSLSKKAMVIGAGSLGSYVLSELPKIGISEIGIIDDDKLSIENIMRHSLGASYVNFEKSFGMFLDLQMKFPQIEVNMQNSKIDIYNIDKYNLEKYDVIIIATGGTDFLLRLNKYFHYNNFKKPVLFTWIEPKGIGVHALLVDYSKKGCYQCLYTGTDRNKAHIGKDNFEIKQIGTGCGAVFNPYGNIVLLKGTAMILEIIDGIFKGKWDKYDENLLFSIKTSNVYTNKELEARRFGLELGSNFYISEGCEICGS